MATIDDIADYVISRLATAETPKRLLADAELDKAILKQAASGNW